MGENLNLYRAKQHSSDPKENAEIFLVNALYLALDKPTLSADQQAEWKSEAKKLTGDPEEIASAFEWAINVSPEWPKYIRRMKNVVDNLDKILRDYRAEMRAKRNADRLINGETASASCQALQAEFPGMLLKSIEYAATKKRVGKEVVEYKKTCKVCKGEIYIKSTDKVTKGLPLFCPACRAFARSIWNGIQKKVREELYA
jgi:hypothetical protein